MGRRGPPKAPTTLRMLRGETRPSRIGHGEPVPRAAEPERPDWFDERHTAVWQRITAEIRGMHLLHSADRDTLVGLVRAIIRLEDAARLVAAEGVIVTGKDGQQVRHPAVIVEREASETVRRLAREFGLTPSGRADLGHAVTLSPPGLGPERLLTLGPGSQNSSAKTRAWEPLGQRPGEGVIPHHCKSGFLSRWPLRARCYRSGSADAARSRATDPATTRAEPTAILGRRRCPARATRRA